MKQDDDDIVSDAETHGSASEKDDPDLQLRLSPSPPGSATKSQECVMYSQEYHSARSNSCSGESSADEGDESLPLQTPASFRSFSQQASMGEDTLVDSAARRRSSSVEQTEEENVDPNRSRLSTSGSATAQTPDRRRPSSRSGKQDRKVSHMADLHRELSSNSI